MKVADPNMIHVVRHVPRVVAEQIDSVRLELRVKGVGGSIGPTLEVLTAVVMDMLITWNITPCSL